MYCHYRIKKWLLHSDTIPDQKNLAYPALVDKSQIYVPRLCTKIGLIKKSMKAVNKENKEFAFLRQKSPKISEAKMKEFSLVPKLTTQRSK
jgi:hypothetical protein